ncbi:hypothetical protein HF673_17460 [Acidithiobacillus thiooxidans]|uniref:Uncharacterized protein n=1 Tax=Acidithiobacillus thiooxidans ATCC 19377 TaxID=637390 RepID=A0A5P9XSI2_ACITH|nr:MULTISPECIES: hypothetical protein [Acidithiobacillus]MBU2741065.1 hypothetical protein [Acidithiobacillus albertensis]MBU2793088.1 hypothetical protein [Acidithiobacillus thiooxidans]MBU2837481.1 hypothetical protein [Acidithiobacillus thiooxidans]QFX96782.1 hypothetical protein GCD22_02605 [Acidithiobacillus thiooxidans ATCC 19377]
MTITETPNELHQLVHKLGGPTFVARELKIPVSTLHGWMKQGQVPNMQKWIELKELEKRMQEVLK